jgi:hypothetical protein
LQKGFSLDYLLNLSKTEKIFLESSMNLAFEEKVKGIKAKALIYVSALIKSVFGG